MNAYMDILNSYINILGLKYSNVWFRLISATPCYEVFDGVEYRTKLLVRMDGESRYYYIVNEKTGNIVIGEKLAS
jgi:hypothetical protein